MSRPFATRLAWGLFALFVAIWITTVLVVAFGAGDATDLFSTVLLGYALVGAILASRLPANAIGWLLLTIGIVLALGALSDANVRSEASPALALSAWVSSWSWFLAIGVAATILPLVFPTGTVASPRWQPALWLAGAAIAMSAIGTALTPGEFDSELPVAVENPVGLPGPAGDAMEVMALGGGMLGVLSALVAAASLVVRFRSGGAIQRQQLKWFAYVGAIAIAGLLLASSGGFGVDTVAIVGWFMALGAIMIGIPAATWIAILRHRLYEIDVVINHTLVYGALTATLAATYIGSVLLLQLALSGLTSGSDLAIAGSTLAVAAIFRPARARIQEAVDRRFYRRRYDTRRTLEGFSARLRDQVDLAALDAELRGVVAETMQPEHVSVWLRAPDAPGG
jgi:hypothetical protein